MVTKLDLIRNELSANNYDLDSSETNCIPESIALSVMMGLVTATMHESRDMFMQILEDHMTNSPSSAVSEEIESIMNDTRAQLS